MSTSRHGTSRAAPAPSMTPTPPRVERTKDRLLSLLDRIDVEGWNGPAATALLTYIRTELIRPLTVDIGLRGAASQAEAIAWESVWLLLGDPSVRSATSPWGVIWHTAHPALLGEVLAARWGTDWRRAWEHDAAERVGAERRPIPIETLAGAGRTPEVQPTLLSDAAPSAISLALEATAAALVATGWADDDAARIVSEIAAMEECLGCCSTVVGWRPLASRLGIPPCQARRLTAALRGTTDRPGLLARLIVEGKAVLDEREVLAPLESTRTRCRRPRAALLHSTPRARTAKA